MSSTYNYQTSNSNHSHVHDDISDEEEFVDCEDNDYEDNNNNNEEHDDDFTFMYINDDKTSKNRQTNYSTLPLCNQNLSSKDGENQLPIQPHVDKVFIKSPQRAPSSSSSTSEYDDCEGVALGPYCTWSKQENAKENVELNKRSNSTGFSKLWRLTGKVGRSNSDGRDAFVFLKRPVDDRQKTTTSSKMVVKRTAVGGSLVKANIDNIDGAKTKVVKIGTKAQNANVSAHEVYLRKKEQTEEERRRSYYLPYRPEIMGFFTNVNGGCLTKNVHPY